LLYILVGVATSVSASALDAISSIITNNIPMYSSARAVRFWSLGRCFVDKETSVQSPIEVCGPVKGGES
jgi:ABC-type Fe3+-siderophore transport system permease subunit